MLKMCSLTLLFGKVCGNIEPLRECVLVRLLMGRTFIVYRNREFWCKEYYVDTVGKNTKAIKQYIADQLKRNQESDQLAMFEPRDPFKGSK